MPSEVAEFEKDNLEKVPFPYGSPPKEAEQLEVVEKETDMTKEWPLMPLSPQLLLRILPKRKRYLPGWKLFLQLFQCLLKTPKVKTKDPRRQPSANLLRPHQRKRL